MANALGRISGQLLKDNLTRNGNDLAFDDDLIYLDVSSRKISINTDTRITPVLVNGKTLTTNLIADNGLTNLGSLEISIANNTITADNDLKFSASTQVYANSIATSSLEFDINQIVNLDENGTIELRPNGTGSVDIFSNTNITGNLTVHDVGPGTGNITLDGSIKFGSDDTDTVTFASDINSDIIPDQNEFYDIGSLQKNWETVYSYLINGQAITLESITSGSINLALRQGNIWYVATNGDDDNVGNHQNGPFATIQKAILESNSGDTIFIYPGTYTEITPLVVPAGVTIRGAGIRAVTIQPDATTDTETVFLLNGESTVSDLSVKNFYAPGYAFAFAPNFTVTSRSPYIQNVTVITNGSVTSIADPRGFDEGDAGGGAYVDGSLALSTSKEASMLFHSVTFITPGVDALVMTNGVRVEWLNSFTYFANRGLYATNGTLGFASLAAKFGAEIRSIGSANVYGNYGAEADGSSTLMYLINHNFAYIGAGKDVSNDSSLNIESNETIEIASGKIYYQSVDNKGNFKVGDAFGVSFETGFVTINGVTVSAGGVTSINFASGVDETVIDATQVTTGNIRFSDNNLTSLVSTIELQSATGEILINSNTDISNNLEVTGDFTIEGELTIGNQYIDVVEFVAPVEFALRPKTHNLYTLGTDLKKWQDIFVDDTYAGTIRINNNEIFTVSSNQSLLLKANGTGKILIPDNDVVFNLNLTVNGITNFQNVNVNDNINLIGNYEHIGNSLQTGNRDISGTLDVTDNIYFDNINIVDNRIFTTDTNSDLELGAVGTGIVRFNEITRFDQSATIGTIESPTINNSGTVTSDVFTNNQISIFDNQLTSTVTDEDLELRAAGTGLVSLPLDPLYIDQNFTVQENTNLKNTVIVGTLDVTGNIDRTGSVNQTGNLDITGNLTSTGTNAFFKNVRFINNQILTSVTNSNLTLQANGTAEVVINDSASLGQQLTVQNTLYTNGITNSALISSDIFNNGDIEIDNNLIRATLNNNNLILKGSGTGGPTLEKIKFNNDTISTETTNSSIIFTTSKVVDFNTNTAVKIPTGTTANRPSLTQGDLRLNTTDSLFRGFSTARVSFGGVYSDNILTNVTAHPTNNTLNFTVNSALAMSASTLGFVANGLQVDNTFFNNNSISTTATNTDLFFTPNGSGSVIIDDIELNSNQIINNSNSPLVLQNTGAGYVHFTGTNGLAIPAGDSASRPLTPETGDMRWNTELSTAEVFNGIEYQTLSGTGGDLLNAEEVQEVTNLWALVLG